MVFVPSTGVGVSLGEKRNGARAGDSSCHALSITLKQDVSDLLIPTPIKVGYCLRPSTFPDFCRGVWGKVGSVVTLRAVQGVILVRK